MKATLVSLGCAKNLVDSEAMAALLAAAGFRLVTETREAEVVVVNTCGFIAPARRESLAILRRLGRLKEKGRCRVLVAAGCLAQRAAGELAALPYVDAVLGTGELARLPQVVEECLQGRAGKVWVGDPEVPLGLPRLLSTGVTAYLKIAEGCDCRCTFCVIPFLRGRYRSRPLEELKEEARRLAEAGARELVLVAEDTSRYGCDLYGGPALARLLRELARVPEIKWIRVLYAYPHLFPREAARVMAEEEKVLPYLDLPLQHVSDRILARMGRPDRGEDIKRLLDQLRARVEGLVLRSTFLIGFPGETEEDFKQLLDFLREYRVERAGFFPFYAEPEAPASRFSDQVPEEVKQARLAEAIACQERISLGCNRRLVGKELEVLVEARGQARLVGGGDLLPRAVGRWAGQAPEVDGQVHVLDSQAQPGEFIRVRVEETFAHDLVAVSADRD